MNPAVTELATATGLLLVTTLHFLGAGLEGLAIRDLGGLEDDRGLVTALGLFNRNLDVILTHA